MKNLLLALLLFPFTIQAQIITTIAGTGVGGFSGDGSAATSAKLDHAYKVAIDCLGNIYVADVGNSRIRIIDTFGIITTIAGTGIDGYSGDGSMATSAELSAYGVALDGKGNFYIADADNNRIRKVNSAGIITTIAGNGINGYSGDSGAATSAELNHPWDVAVDSSGNIYIADVGNSRIRIIDTFGIITTIAGNGIDGFSGDGGAATSAELSAYSVALDGKGNFYIADADNNRIRKVNSAGIITTIAGNGTGGYSGDDGAATSAELNHPWEVVVADLGNIYIADVGNNLIREVNGSGIITRIAGNGIDGYSGDSGAATLAELSAYGVALDGNGNLYIADGDNNRIRKVNCSMPLVGGITGTSTVCVDADIALTDITTGGTWNASNINAFVSSTGTVLGFIAGIDTIQYSVTNSCGTGTAIVSYTVTINPLPVAGSIIGTSTVCVDASITLTNVTTGGIWTATNSNATVTGGTVSGISSGVDTIEYSVTNSCGTAVASHSITVNPLPVAGSITGTSTVCVDASITLTDIIIGGTWNASNNNAFVSSSGTVLGFTTGIDTISYSVTNSCGTAVASHSVIVNPLPVAGSITGTSTVCVDASITLTDVIIGGTWTATNSNATVTGGTVSGISSSVDTIEYSVTNSCGTAIASHNVTVNPLPVAGSITGTSTVCLDANITLTNVTTGGTWTATNSNAIVMGGTVSGISSGVDTIEYWVTNSCGTAVASHIVTINPLPVAGSITGTSTVCVDANITLTNVTTGGIWTATNSNATITGGTVNGISSGVDTIEYSVTNSCGTAVATYSVTINPLPVAGSITGTSTVCVDANITLTNVTTGGTWDASNINAFVSSSGTVLGFTTGIDTISYSITNSCGTAVASHIVTVNPLPVAGCITGTSTVCVDANITITDVTTGGIWTATNSNATVTGGTVSGISSNVDTIQYSVTNSCGTAVASHNVTVNPLPVAGSITGTSTVCVDANITLTDVTTGGTWTATNSNAIVMGGTVSGISSGVDTIEYSVTNSCGTAVASHIVTINPLPVAGSITGASTVCVDASITLTDVATGGTWTATNSNATVTGGIVSGISSGVDTIQYSVTNSCGTAVASHIVTVNPLPVAGSITSASTVCVDASITLTDVTTGGIWNASNNNAFVSSSGTVLGFTTGIDTISYSVTNSCGTAVASHSVTVNPLPVAGSITGTSTVCVDASITLTDVTTGGTWTATNSNATVIGGTVSGIISGVDTIEYSVTNSCGTAVASHSVIVNPLPVAGSITGTSTVCVDASITITDVTTAGTWTATNSNATFTGGTVSGVSSGVDTIKYSVTNSCGTAVASHIVTINPLPVAGSITGTSTVCVDASITLTDVIIGGTWTATNSNANVTSGMVSGISSGVDTIEYSVTNSCGTAIATHIDTVYSVAKCDSLSGVKEIITPKNELNVYPNPANSIINFEFSEQKDGTIRIMDMLGRTIENKVIESKKTVSIDVTNYKTGNYIYQVITNNGIWSGKIRIE